MKHSFFGGIHPDDGKRYSAAAPITPLAPPGQVVIPVSMHIGGPCKPVVQKGDQVKLGQLIAETTGFVAAPIHASVSGTVAAVEPRLHPNGQKVMSIVIDNDGLDTRDESVRSHVSEVTADPHALLELVKSGGIVGMGGATFPTHVKISSGLGKVDTMIVNAAECEPYITADTRTMLDDAEMLVGGVELLHGYYPKARVIIGIENNKPACVKKLRELLADKAYAEVNALPALYPQGGEKVLIHNTTGRIVPEGKLPIDVGCIVINTSTLVSITRYIRTGMPLVEKYVTVDGSAIKNPQNVIVPIGTAIRDVVEFTGGYKCEPKKIVLGGPMMGVSVPDDSEVVVKNTGAILCFDEKDAVLPEPSACIRCGRCIDACPLNLMPTEIEHAFNVGDAERLGRLKVNLCMECGCCAFACPAKRPLVQTHKLAKGVLNAYNLKLKAEAEKKAAKEAEK